MLTTASMVENGWQTAVVELSLSPTVSNVLKSRHFQPFNSLSNAYISTEDCIVSVTLLCYLYCAFLNMDLYLYIPSACSNLHKELNTCVYVYSWFRYQMILTAHAKDPLFYCRCCVYYFRSQVWIGITLYTWQDHYLMHGFHRYVDI